MKYLRHRADGFVSTWNESAAKLAEMQPFECLPDQLPAGPIADLDAFLRGLDGTLVEAPVKRGPGRPPKAAQ